MAAAEAQIAAIFDAFLAENVKKGWVECAVRRFARRKSMV